MRLSLTLLFAALSTLLVATRARADDKHVCSEAYKAAQELRDDHKLRDARDQLHVCGRAECPGFIAKDCTAWLAQVEASMPSVIFRAKSGTGTDVVDVKVSMDGIVVARGIDGRSVDVDPGPHTFVFEAADGGKAEQQMVVREGTKNQEVSATLRTLATTPSSPTSAHEAASEAPRHDAPSAWKPLGFVLAGLGVVGVGVGLAFGLMAMSKNNTAACDANDICKDPQARRDAQGLATPSTLGLVAGGVLLAGGVAMVLLAPKEGTRTARLEAAPLVGADAGGLLVRGVF